MQRSLFLFVLLGQCFFFTCHLYEYRFITENKTWHEAQRYCRENYTDLAKVFNLTGMESFYNLTTNQREAWFGLYKNTDGNMSWHWSLPGVEYIQNNSYWNLSEIHSNEGQGNCGRKRDKWANASCAHGMWFICYDEKKKSNETLYLIKNSVNWTRAQNYCRYNHTDLASGLDQVDGEEMKALFNSNGGPMSVWIGLFRDSWRWSDGSDFSFRYWDMQLFSDEQSNKKCAMTLLNKSGKWSSDECGKEKPFFCYDDKVILVKENKTWEEALYYCRDKYLDLVSITNLEDQQWVQEKAKNASTPFVWLGLRYTCTLGFWFWVTDEVVEYKNWASDGKTDGCDMSAAMERGGKHKWFSKLDNNLFNFFCYKN